MDIEKSKLSETFFASLNIIFFALFAGQTIYFIVGLFLIQSGDISVMPELNTVFLFVTPVVILFAILASKIIYIKLVGNFDKSSSFENKMISYRKNSIIKLALLEGANVFSISIMIITANYFYASFFVILITLFFFNRPTKEKFIIDYEVTADEALNILL